MPRHLRVLFHDQASKHLSVLQKADSKKDHILMVVSKRYFQRNPHHKQKIVFLWAVMAQFADDLKEMGWHVTFVTPDDTQSLWPLKRLISFYYDRHDYQGLHAGEPFSWGLYDALVSWSQEKKVPLTWHRSPFFLDDLTFFKQWSAQKKTVRMEYFYREMRKKTGYLMENNQPIGGQWNFDADNRHPGTQDLNPPDPFCVPKTPYVKDILKKTQHHFPHHPGSLDTFAYATTRTEALQVLEYFINHLLPSFGRYQDAMVQGKPFLYHSVLSPYLNTNLLTPKEVCDAAQKAYDTNKAPLNSVEGFIRQILGWREFIRGLYWIRRQDYENPNFFSFKNPLPAFYWTGDTSMVCLKEALQSTLQYGYAHHIHRLMITGNYALLHRTNPEAIHRWYLSVYIDAHDWVERVNTLGMSQFSDGGIMASKPYISGGAYIKKMSTYCEKCPYDPSLRHGEKACPFNVLFWAFLHDFRDILASKGRLSPLLKNLDRFESTGELPKILESAQKMLKKQPCESPWKEGAWQDTS